MSDLRLHLVRHRWAAAGLLFAALLLRIFVPAGFMPQAGDGTITMVLCSGTGPQTIQVTLPGVAERHQHGGEKEGGKADAPCAFAGLSAPILSAADPLLLAAAIAFFMLLAVRTPDRPPVTPHVRLRPPLRGPPSLH